jgi:hypothetical protein
LATFSQISFSKTATDLAPGVSEAPVLLGRGPFALQAFLAGVEELVAPDDQAVGIDAQLTAQLLELLELLATMKAKHHVELLVR